MRSVGGSYSSALEKGGEIVVTVPVEYDDCLMQVSKPAVRIVVQELPISRKR